MTTVQISNKLQETLMERKFFNRETYEEVIWNLIEDVQELNEETKKELKEARAEVKAGKVHTMPKVKKELGINV